MAKTTTTRASSSAKASPAQAPANAEAMSPTSIALAQAQDLAAGAIDAASTNTPGDDLIGGAGDPASPAEVSGIMMAALDIPAEKFRERWPLFATALEGFSAAGAKGDPVLKVSTKAGTFRRGGLAHGVEPASYPLESLHPDAVEAILGEPMLVAELVGGE